MLKSYQDLLRIYEILKSELEYIYSQYGIELRLSCYEEENLSVLKKNKDFFIKELKEKVIDIFNVIYYCPDNDYDEYKLVSLFDFDFKKIVELSKYFKSLFSVMHGEYQFAFKASELFDDSVNEICFDILGRAFLEARASVMCYNNMLNNNSKISNYSKFVFEYNFKLFKIYDSNGKRLDNKKAFSKVREIMKK